MDAPSDATDEPNAMKLMWSDFIESDVISELTCFQSGGDDLVRRRPSSGLVVRLDNDRIFCHPLQIGEIRCLHRWLNLFEGVAPFRVCETVAHFVTCETLNRMMR